MSILTKPNGRRRWRQWAKSARWGSEYNWNTLRRHPDVGLPRLEPPPLPSPPWSPRSLVGMSESAKKRTALRELSKLQILKYIPWFVTKYRIGERLRLCPGCFQCREDFQGYGFFPGGDPRDFTPDEECSTEEERERHRADCKAWERGERPRRKTSGLEWTDAIAATNKNGEPTTIPAGYKFVSRSAYGLGSYQIGRRRRCNGSGVVPARKAVHS